MRRASLFVGSLALTALFSQTTRAQASTPSVSKVDPVLAAEARISLDSARAIALRKVSNGRVAAEELEREHGKLIYSFDVKVPGRSGIQEVNVSAIDGTLIGVHHESAATEAKEAREDSVAAARKSVGAHPNPSA